MRFKHYMRVIDRLSEPCELRRLLNILENDMDVSARGYGAIRYVVLRKVYGISGL